MGLTFIDFEKWCHLDFVYAVDIRKYLNKQLLEFIQDVTGNPASIDMMVQTARKERNRTATPVDKPVNETDFINKVQ